MKLPEPLQKRIRYVATLRNKTMHEEGFEIANIPEYVKTCQSIAEQLEHLHANRKPSFFSQVTGGSWMRKVALIGCAGVGIFGLAYLGMATALKYEQPSRVVAAHDVGATNPAPARTQAQPTAPSAPARPARATPPAPAASVKQKEQPALKAAVAPAEKKVEPLTQAPQPQTQVSTEHQPTEAISPSAPVTFKNLKFSLKNDGWGRMEPSLSATFINSHSATISNIRVKIRLFINGETTPVAGNTSRDGEFYVFFGDSGLAPGASAAKSMSFFGFDKDSWKVPDVVNAKTRVVEMKIIAAEDGRKNTVKVPNTGWLR
ncbi:hypothetical protein D3C71_1246200 [compost metagenome]